MVVAPDHSPGGTFVVMMVAGENCMSLSDGERRDLLVGCCCAAPFRSSLFWCTKTRQKIATRLSNSNRLLQKVCSRVLVAI